MATMLPVTVAEKLEELLRLCDEHPNYLPLPEVAKLLGVKCDGLRNSIEHGRCPFGISWQLGANKAFKVPTATFYLWYTNGGGLAMSEVIGERLRRLSDPKEER